ncbi:MAG: hypothetical protein JWM09_651 [Francisellaceae bacterium]|nr:hypothetical protein [Francisellaceae bacterium]
MSLEENEGKKGQFDLNSAIQTLAEIRNKYEPKQASNLNDSLSSKNELPVSEKLNYRLISIHIGFSALRQNIRLRKTWNVQNEIDEASSNANVIFTPQKGLMDNFKEKSKNTSPKLQ